MYLEHFGLGRPPFRITPNQDFFYSGANRGAILDALVYAITSGEGIIKLVGEVGTGKTMLCRALEGRLPANVDIIYLPNPSLPPEEILCAIADELGFMRLADLKPNQLIREMQNHLIEKHAQGRQVVVIIDEAQAMPLDSLEEIRLLSNLETASSKLLQIVLFGQPELDQNINQPQIRQLKERITQSFYLQPFNGKEVADYLVCRMRIAGYRGPPIFSQAAIRLICKASLGLIRRVNILADKSLLAAFSGNTHVVTARQVKAAIRDSSYNPLPPSKRAKLALVLLLSVGILSTAMWAAMEWPVAAPEPPKPPSVAPVQPAQLPTKTETAVSSAESAPLQELPEETPAMTISAVNAGHEELNVPPQSTLQSRLETSRQWLKDQNGANYSIQLMAVSPEMAATELERIQAQLAPEQLIVYPNTINNKAAITIATGSFPSIAEAKAALAKLPTPYSQYNPLLRTIKSIRDGAEKKYPRGPQ